MSTPAGREWHIGLILCASTEPKALSLHFVSTGHANDCTADATPQTCITLLASDKHQITRLGTVAGLPAGLLDKRKRQVFFHYKRKRQVFFHYEEKDRPRPVPVDIGSRGRQTPSPRAFWPPNRTFRYQMTNRDRGSAQNFKANPTVIVDLRDQDFFRPFLWTEKRSFPLKKRVFVGGRGLGELLVYAASPTSDPLVGPLVY